MNRRTFVKTLPTLTVLASTTVGFTQDTPKAPQDLKPVTLPRPDMDGGKSVLAALKERKTTRNISTKELPAHILSNLLWAAFGVNRAMGSFGKPGRTAASASNSQEIDLYIALPEGVYLYEAAPHRLAPVVAGDFRGRAGRGGAASAPVNIFYVADLARYDTGPGQPDRKIGDPEVQKLVLLHRYGAHSRQCLFVRGFARVGGVVPQLQQGGRGEGFQIAKRTARAFCADSWISCLAALANASTHPDI